MDRDPEKKNPQKNKFNCWEVMMCGRELGGKNAAEFGVCPAAADVSFDGINSGKCGGRICWAVAGTLCGGCVQGSFAEKRCSCLNCDFYQMVQEEEGLANRQRKFLQFLSQENRSPFFDKMTYRHVKAGERFVIQDAVENTAYIIQRGSCLVIVETVCLKIITEKRKVIRGESRPLSPPPICVEAADKVYGLGKSRMEQIQIKHSGWDHELLL